jgi:chorismate synthase
MITNRLRFLTAGESHGPALISVLEGIPAGLPLNVDLINQDLLRRQTGYGAGLRMKIERDQAVILGGVMEGVTIGSPISIKISNINHNQWRGKVVDAFTSPRPGHADLTGAIKYGYRDLRPGLERASARETAARVAVGAICKQLMSEFGVQIFGYVSAIGEVSADLSEVPIGELQKLAEASEVRCPDLGASRLMQKRIREVKEARDTLGGVIEVLAIGLPPGLGSHVHWDRKLDSRLGAAVLSVPAVKGVSIGPAFENARLTGTLVHDAIELPDSLKGVDSTGEESDTNNREDTKGKSIIRPTNRAGGLEGGITNGQPVVVLAAMKPIASTLEPQRTVDLVSGKPTPTTYERSDFCPVPRAVPILEAVVAIILADALLEKLGGDSLTEMKPRYNQLRKANLEDLEMDGDGKVFWPK